MQVVYYVTNIKTYKARRQRPTVFKRRLTLKERKKTIRNNITNVILTAACVFGVYYVCVCRGRRIIYRHASVNISAYTRAWFYNIQRRYIHTTY